MSDIAKVNINLGDGEIIAIGEPVGKKLSRAQVNQFRELGYIGEPDAEVEPAVQAVATASKAAGEGIDGGDGEELPPDIDSKLAGK